MCKNIKVDCLIFSSDIGLFRGEITSPIMFSLFQNDIELHLQENIDVGIDIDQISVYHDLTFQISRLKYSKSFTKMDGKLMLYLATRPIVCLIIPHVFELVTIRTLAMKENRKATPVLYTLTPLKMTKHITYIGVGGGYSCLLVRTRMLSSLIQSISSMFLAMRRSAGVMWRKSA